MCEQDVTLNLMFCSSSHRQYSLSLLWFPKELPGDRSNVDTRGLRQDRAVLPS